MPDARHAKGGKASSGTKGSKISVGVRESGGTTISGSSDHGPNTTKNPSNFNYTSANFTDKQPDFTSIKPAGANHGAKSAPSNASNKPTVAQSNKSINHPSNNANNPPNKLLASGCVQEAPGGGAIHIHILVKPGAKDSALTGLDQGQGELGARLAAKPQDGEANAELVRLLAEILGLPRGQVALLHGGGKNRSKTAVVAAGGERGVTVASVVAKLERALADA